MSQQTQSVKRLDYYQENASDQIVPQPAVLRSLGWSGLHLELHQQPAFATGAHQHSMHIIACGVSSSKQNAPGERLLDGKRMRERRDSSDIAIIPAGITHACSWDTSAQFIILAIEPTLLQHMGQEWIKPERIELVPRFMNESDPLLHNIVSTLKGEAATSGMGSDLLIDSLKTTLAIHLLRNYCVTHPQLSSYTRGLSARTLTLVKEYIANHCQRTVTLGELAVIAQISPYHFLRLFKQSMGITPHQYILQYRLNEVKRLLQHSDLSIVEIASRTGFCDQSHLTRYCKRTLGMTPKQLRQMRSVAHDGV